MLLSNTLVFAVFASIAAAAPSKPKVLQFPVTKHHKSSQLVNGTLSQRDAVTEDVKNKEFWYSISLSLGTPAQNFNVLLDTGSSDLWVYGSNDQTDCGSGQCEFTGLFDAEASSTYTLLNHDYSIQYVTGAATGDWVLDTLAVGSVTLQDFQFAVASSAKGRTGVFGISLEGSESLNHGRQPEYANFPVQLRNQGYIERTVYSLYLNSFDATDGTFLLGGIDYAKFEGPLTVIPLENDRAFQVAYDSIGYNGQFFGASNIAVLDSGTSYTFIPNDAFYPISDAVGLSSETNDNTGLNYIDCGSDVALSFVFNGVTVNVASRELVLPLSTIIGDPSNTQCVFGVQTNDQTQNITLFGDTFLRSAYVVYDLDNAEVGLAQAIYTDATNVQAVTGAI